MRLETAEKIAEQLGPYLLNIELDNWGEPLLHPQIFELVKIFKRAKVQTAMSSNLSLKDFNPEAMVDSGLDILIVSTDGASEETYLKYRWGGNFSLVLENIKQLVGMKKKMKKPNPYILMKFITFPHNLHEQEEFKQLAKTLEVNDALFSPPYYIEFLLNNYLENLTPDQVSQVLNRPKPPKMRTCYWPWSAVNINWDGSISVCCARNSYHQEFDLGNINDTDFKEVWFGPVYSEIRKVFYGIEPQDRRARACWHCWTGTSLPPHF